MRRRALLREPASQSLCIFCTHRLGGLRPSAPYIHRRPLHSSRPSSKPPGTAAAEQKSHDNGITYPSNEPSLPQSKNGNSVFGSASTGGFGRPSFGSKPAFAAPAPNFGSKPTFGTPVFGSKPAFATGGGAPSFDSKPKFGGVGGNEASPRPTFEGTQGEAASSGSKPTSNTPVFGSKPAFGGGGGAPSFDASPSFGSKPKFGGVGEEGAASSGAKLGDGGGVPGSEASPRPTFPGEREVTSSGSNPNPGVKSASEGPSSLQDKSVLAKGRGPIPGDNTSYDVKPVFGTKTPQSPISKPVFGGGAPSTGINSSFDVKQAITRGSGVAPSFESTSSDAKPAIGKESETAPASESKLTLGPEPIAEATQEKETAPKSNIPSFGSRAIFGGAGVAPAVGSSVRFGFKPTFSAGGGAAQTFGQNTGFGDKPTFSAPKFGNNTSFGVKPTFGSSSTSSESDLTAPTRTNLSTAGNSEQGWVPQAPAIRSAELTPEEKIARERLVQMHQRTIVNVYGGAGPESTRAGRFIPRSEEEKRAQLAKNSSIEWARNGLERKIEGSQNRNESGSINSDTGFRNLRAEPSSRANNFDGHDSRIYNQSENWTHLKRRQQESSLAQEASQGSAQDRENSAFVVARAEREKQAESRRFVPLANRPPPNRQFIPRQDEDRQRPRYPKIDAYGQTLVQQEQPGPKIYDPYAPIGQRSTPISPGEWRNEKPRRDDRLRRINRDGDRYDSGAGSDRTSRPSPPYDTYDQSQASRDMGHSRRQDENVEAQGFTRDTFNGRESHRSFGGFPEPELRTPNSSRDTFSGYESSRPSEEAQKSEPYRAYKPLEPEYTPSKRNTFTGYEISSAEESQRQEDTGNTQQNILSGYEIYRPSEESQRPGNTRNSEQPSARYEDIPKGKQRDKARRRENFVSSYEQVDEEAAARAELKRQRKLEKAAKKAAALTPILLPEWISVSNLATALKVRLEDFAVKLEDLGFLETNHDHVLGAEDAGLIAQEYGFEPIIDRDEGADLKARPPAEDVSTLPPRPPVVTIMGHVDHGKTTLLDWLRKSSVVDSEHGGITQHIGAFSVTMPSGKIITFLDTPGHAAFLSMRQRGANVTDIVILVVAADDSVKPQTIEAINHAKAAKVPMIVAINKIDKEDSNVDRVKQDLARHGVEVEDIGGDTQVVCVSGKTGQGMAEMEEAVVTLSEILDMRAETDGQAEGWVIEASIKSMGKVATVLVKRGTMRIGDFIVAGKTWARIRCMRDEAGVEVEEAGPGTPVEIDGWREQPLAGDEVLQATSEDRAKRAVDYRVEKEEREKMAADMEAINDIRKAEQEKREREKHEAAIAAGEVPEEEVVEEEEKAEDSTPGIKDVYFIVKGDVSGSVEAVVDSISALGTNEVRARIIRSGVGQLTEFDVEHAAAAKGLLINFNTEVDPSIASRAARAGITILDHNIIYRLVDDVRAKLSEQLPPIISQKVTGEAEVSKIFEITVKGRKQKSIAGCKVRLGVINRASKVKVMRSGEKIFDGTFSSLKNVKKDVTEMRKGTECGIGFVDWADFQVGDLIQCYEEVTQKRYL